ncbi:MAG: hypothetical protein KAJ49_04505 [Arcobacteraceae bacterium]|nr:hypothetical protein [Arcobacteraceae bacterium]
MNKWKTISLVLGLTTYLPIWFYLMYKILQYIEASELMWFLFWIYLPVTIIITIISKIGEEK